MKIVKPYYVIETDISEGGQKELEMIEKAARTCYKSEDFIKEGSAEKIVRALIKRGHEAMLEHSMLTVRFVCDRGVSHELVRHRLCSFAQESTRYCNYGKDKFGSEITFVEPLFFEKGSDNYHLWELGCMTAEKIYLTMLQNGAQPGEARTILGNSLKTEVVVTANYREWRNIFRLRCASDAHEQMRELMIPLKWELKDRIPVIFEDL